MSTRNYYYEICERGFANENEILIVNSKEDEKFLQALWDWKACSPNGYFARIKRKDISRRDFEFAIPISEFRFVWRANDSEEERAKDYFNFRKWEDGE